MMLLLLVLVLFVNRKSIKSLANQKTGDKLLIGATVVSCRIWFIYLQLFTGGRFSAI
jgi:hypothetical protein